MLLVAACIVRHSTQRFKVSFHTLDVGSVHWISAYRHVDLSTLLQVVAGRDVVKSVESATHEAIQKNRARPCISLSRFLRSWTLHCLVWRARASRNPHFNANFRFSTLNAHSCTQSHHIAASSSQSSVLIQIKMVTTMIHVKVTDDTTSRGISFLSLRVSAGRLLIVTARSMRVWPVPCLFALACWSRSGAESSSGSWEGSQDRR